MVSKILCQEEVPVFIIRINRDFKRFGLHASFGGNGFGFRFLLGKKRIDTQASKLQIRFHTEQGSTTIDQ